MTKITMTEGKKSLTLTMKGHAGAGEPGRDLVCAGLSLLAYTGARVGQILLSGPDPPLTEGRVSMEPGDVSMEFLGREGSNSELRALGTFLLAGFTLLREDYPLAVSVCYEKEGEKEYER